MKLKRKLYRLAMIFCACWVWGEVCKGTYTENLSFGLAMVTAFSIYFGVHGDIKRQIKRLFA